jgi:hypothetical protein
MNPCSMLMLYYFLDAFAKLRKATISFFVSVRPSVNTNNWTPTALIVMKFGICLFFQNPLRKFEYHLYLARITITLNADQ